MKFFRVASTVLLCLISVTANAQQKSLEKENKAPPSGLEDIKAEKLTGRLDKEYAYFTAHGTVPSGGWSQAQLSPVIHVRNPDDGIWLYHFTAIKPEVGTSVISPISSKETKHLLTKEAKGIMVPSQEGFLVLRFLNVSQDPAPKPRDPVSIRSIKIDSTVVEIGVEFSGSSKKGHRFELHWDGSYDKSIPPVANFVLLHDAQGDAGEVMLKDVIRVALPKIDSTAGINVSNGSDESIQITPKLSN